MPRSQRGFAHVFIILAVLALVLVASYFVLVSNRAMKVSNDQVEVSKPQKVEFTYKVKSVEEDKVVLSGRDGDLTLRKSFISSIYNGPSRGAPRMTFEGLKANDPVNVEFTPGKSAVLFVWSL